MAHFAHISSRRLIFAAMMFLFETVLVGFADVGETLADHLGLAAGKHGRSFL